MQIRIRNGKVGFGKFGSGIRDKHPGSATLVSRVPDLVDP
jgi:hypothetical protein